MAHIGKLPGLQRIVTTHNEKGEAIIDKDVDTNAPFDGNIENGRAAFCLGYTTTEFPVDLNNNKDVDTYKQFLVNPPGIVQNRGSVLRVVDMGPGCLSPMHRTVSLDYGVVLIGEVELVLDSGEVRLMKPRDICVQRGTMHAWRNTSKTEWARMLYVLQPSLPVSVAGTELVEDYGNMAGVPSSS